MQCQNCRYELPPGVAFCPNCGATVAQGGAPGYPAPTVFASPPNSGVPPTMFASSPNQEVPPTVAASAPGQPVPPSNPYGTPPTNYGDSAPPPPPMNPYSTPPATPYNVPPQGPSYPPSQGQYNAPGTFVPPQQFVPQQPKKNNGCVIAVIIVLVLVLLIGGGIATAFAIFVNRAGNVIATAGTNLQTAIPTINSELTPEATTPATTNTGNAPTADQIDAAAAQQILSTQLASGVNDDLEPLDNKTSFAPGDKIYLTFTTAGHNGYILAKWYLDGQHGFDNDILQDSDGNTVGYVAGYFNLKGNVVIGLYWCSKVDCSDAALAKVANATVG